MPTHLRKPDWLKIDIGSSNAYTDTKRVVEDHCLHTICTSGKCPNRGECWRMGTATFMIGGNICTRACKFCNTPTGRPLPLDPLEPERVARSVKLLKLKHAVITSVDRDDLPDYGAAHWARTIHAIQALNPDVTIEVLIPDFRHRTELVQQVIDCRPQVISHNMETVRRLTPHIRSVATYDGSLQVLCQIAEAGIRCKSGIMVGLGETADEVYELMDDLVRVGCQVLTIGQYLQPTHRHYPVQEYVPPTRFCTYREVGLQKGFDRIESGPLVRSSYHAERHL